MARILIADDNSQNLYTLESILKAYGYGVTSARNGSEALELARRSRPDLIISDIFIPVMDGFALCREWKADERLKDTPFIFHTATYNDPKDEQFAIDWLCREFMKLHPGINVEFETRLEGVEIPENLKISIFRIGQESLNNAAKHSGAESVHLSLARNRDYIELTIADAGIGMDLHKFVHNPAPMSLGLAGMRERAELTGGRFSIESTYGHGTTIRASWPIGLED